MAFDVGVALFALAYFGLFAVSGATAVGAIVSLLAIFSLAAATFLMTVDLCTENCAPRSGWTTQSELVAIALAGVIVAAALRAVPLTRLAVAASGLATGCVVAAAFAGRF